MEMRIECRGRSAKAEDRVAPAELLAVRTHTQCLCTGLDSGTPLALGERRNAARRGERLAGKVDSGAECVKARASLSHSKVSGWRRLRLRPVL